MENSPEDLLRLAREGDLAALGTLLADYRRYLTFLARTQINRRLQAKVDASDLTQEVCLEAHRHFERFRGTSEGEFTAWLRSILAGLIALHARRYFGTKRRDVRLEQAIAAEMDHTSMCLERDLAVGHTSPSQKAMHREVSVMLANAMESLPDDYRQVIMLRHFEGCAFAQVAERMERSVDSVEKLWVRALGRLRQSLRNAT